MGTKKNDKKVKSNINKTQIIKKCSTKCLDRGDNENIQETNTKCRADTK